MENILTAYFHSMSNVVPVEEHLDRIFLFNYFHSVSKVVLVSPPTVGWTRWLFWELDGRGRGGEVGKWENKLGIRQQATATHIPESF